MVYFLSIFHKCNNNCVYCSYLKKKCSREKDTDEIKKEIHEAKKEGFTKIRLSCSSEFRKDFFDILKLIKRNNFELILETNGRMFCYDDFFRKVVKLVDKFVIFLNGDAYTHNSIVKTRSFQQTLKGLKRLVVSEVRLVEVFTVLTKSNYKKLDGLFILVNGLSIKNLNIIYDPSNHSVGPSIKDCYKYFNKAVALARKFDLSILICDSAGINRIDWEEFKIKILETKGIIPFPRKLLYEPTAICNLRCSMCERYKLPSQKEFTKELKFPEIKRFIKELPEEIENVYISGGEPFLRNDIKDICQEFLKKGISVSIQTNGTSVDKILSLAKNKKIDLLFSLDGQRSIHDQIRGRKGVYDKNIEIFKVLKNKMNKGIFITSVITDENIDNLERFIDDIAKSITKPSFMIIEYARRFTTDVINSSAKLLRIKSSDIPLRVKNNILPSYSYEKFRKNLVKINQTLENNKIDHCYFPEKLLENKSNYYFRTYRKKNKLYCSHLNELRIDSRGNVIPCFVIRKNFGNIKKESIKKIWNSKEFCQFRMSLIKNNLAPICETCYRAVDKNFYKDFYLTGLNTWKVENKKRTVKKTNKKIGFGLFGTGWAASMHLEAISTNRFAELIGVYSNSKKRGREFAREHKIKYYNHYSDMLMDNEIDIVDIATCSNMHAKYALEAVKYNKHVIVEKPIDIDIKKAIALINLARKRNKKLICVSEFRFSKDIQKLKQLINKNKLGRVHLINVSIPLHRDNKYFLNSPWRGEKKQAGGGIIIMNMIHLIDILIWLFGSIKKVYGSKNKLRKKLIKVEDYAGVLIEFKNQLIAVISATNTIIKSMPIRIEIHGTKDSIILEDFNIIRKLSSQLPKRSDFKNKLKQYYHLQIEDAVKVIRYNKKPSVTGRESLEVLKAVNSIYKSCGSK